MYFVRRRLSSLGNRNEYLRASKTMLVFLRLFPLPLTRLRVGGGFLSFRCGEMEMSPKRPQFPTHKSIFSQQKKGAGKGPPALLKRKFGQLDNFEREKGKEEEVKVIFLATPFLSLSLLLSAVGKFIFWAAAAAAGAKRSRWHEQRGRK